MASSALSVITINLVNILLPVVLRKLGVFERHLTRTTEQRSTTQALLIMYFMNTAITVGLQAVTQGRGYGSPSEVAASN